MFETLLKARLSAIGQAANVYPLAAPEGFDDPANAVDGVAAYPVIVYQRAVTKPIEELNQAPDTAFITFQVDTYDPSYLNAKSLAETVRKNLVAWKEDDVLAVQWTDESDWIDQTKFTSLYSTMLQFVAIVRV